MKKAPVVTQLASGLGWPEGPAPLPDGCILFVESYRSQVSVWTPGASVRQFADVGGGPNAVLAAPDGYLYVTDGGKPGLTAEPSMGGALWRVALQGVEGLPLFPGHIG